MVWGDPERILPSRLFFLLILVLLLGVPADCRAVIEVAFLTALLSLLVFLVAPPALWAHVMPLTLSCLGSEVGAGPPAVGRVCFVWTGFCCC
ncbi:hypothetical protein V8C42DRAFT_338454 [Trichoderma barbatum]